MTISIKRGRLHEKDRFLHCWSVGGFLSANWLCEPYDMPIENRSGGTSGLIAFTIDELADLEQHCTDIVKGTVLIGDQKIRISSRGNWKDGKYNYFTQSTLTITDVYKGDLKPGMQVTIAGPWFVEKNEKGDDVLYVEGGYMPSDPKQEYIFCLVYSGEGVILNDVYVPLTAVKARRKILCKRNSTKSRMALEKQCRWRAESLGYPWPSVARRYARRRRECRRTSEGTLKQGVSRRHGRRT